MFFVGFLIFLGTLSFVTMPIWISNVIELIEEHRYFNRKTVNYEPIKIKFKQFCEFHAIAPHKWKYDTNKDYFRKKRIKCLVYNEPHHALYNGYCIQFSFVDFLKFKRFVKQYEKHKANLKDMSAKEEFIKYVQQDVNNYNDELIKMLKKEK